MIALPAEEFFQTEVAPAAAPVFTAALVLHIAAGLSCLVAGVLAMTARKAPGRHPRAGTVYHRGLALLFGTATVMALIRLSHSWHLLVIATVAFGAVSVGYRAARRRQPGWLRRHIIGMGLSYIALLTGFYVDNGAKLPLWDRLPHLAYWVLPAAAGTPLILRALARRRLLGPRGSGVPHGRPG